MAYKDNGKEMALRLLGNEFNLFEMWLVSMETKGMLTLLKAPSKSRNKPSCNAFNVYFIW